MLYNIRVFEYQGKETSGGIRPLFRCIILIYRMLNPHSWKYGYSFKLFLDWIKPFQNGMKIDIFNFK